MYTATIAQARARFGELIERARRAETPTLITKAGRPAAVVVSVGWYESHRDASDEPAPVELPQPAELAAAANGAVAGEK